MKFKDMDAFKKFIRVMDDEELNRYGVELEKAIVKTRNPEIRLGRAMMIDECYCEAQRRKQGPLPVMSDDEILSELLA